MFRLSTMKAETRSIILICFFVSTGLSLPCAEHTALTKNFTITITEYNRMIKKTLRQILNFI